MEVIAGKHLPHDGGAGGHHHDVGGPAVQQLGPARVAEQELQVGLHGAVRIDRLEAAVEGDLVLGQLPDQELAPIELAGDVAVQAVGPEKAHPFVGEPEVD
ncbi:MAG: hypothetical protein ACYCW6_22625, partial [Candidatus Xenobia bacterium]